MAKYTKRSQARSMRKNGISIVIIAKKLDVSKSSVSMWCRDIILTQEQNERLNKNRGVSFMNGRRLGAETNRLKKLKAIESANTLGLKTIRKISKRDLLLACVALYWCEGSKTDSTSSFMFVNSDPEMVLIMKNFLMTIMGVIEEDIFCCIQINKIHQKRIEKVLIFWQKLLKLKESQIRKPYFINTKVSKIYDNYDDYYGVCRLVVKRSKYLKYKMLGLIKALKLNIKPA